MFKDKLHLPLNSNQSSQIEYNIDFFLYKLKNIINKEEINLESTTAMTLPTDLKNLYYLYDIYKENENELFYYIIESNVCHIEVIRSVAYRLMILLNNEKNTVLKDMLLNFNFNNKKTQIERQTLDSILTFNRLEQAPCSLNANFVGRKVELKEINNAFQSGLQYVYIYGRTGIGKSA